MSASTDGQFILDLAPRHPIYLELLPDAVQRSVGRVHRDGEAARVMLARENFRPQNLVDIFDAGPTMAARRDEITSVRNNRRHRGSRRRHRGRDADAGLARRGWRASRAVRAPVRLDEEDAVVSAEVADAPADRRGRHDPDRPMSGELYIGGRWREGRGEALVSTDPATGAEVWRGATANGADVFDAGGGRRRRLPRLGRRVSRNALGRRPAATSWRCEARTPEIAADLSRETGKPLLGGPGPSSAP